MHLFVGNIKWIAYWFFEKGISRLNSGVLCVAWTTSTDRIGSESSAQLLLNERKAAIKQERFTFQPSHQKVSTSMGLEPTTFGSEVRRAIHYATKPLVLS